MPPELSKDTAATRDAVVEESIIIVIMIKLVDGSLWPLLRATPCMIRYMVVYILYIFIQQYIYNKKIIMKIKKK